MFTRVKCFAAAAADRGDGAKAFAWLNALATVRKTAIALGWRIMVGCVIVGLQFDSVEQIVRI